MTDRQLLVLIVMLLFVLGVAVFSLDAITKDDIEILVAFATGAGFLYAMSRIGGKQ